MKRIMIYIAVLVAALLVPLRGTDVGKLEPVGLLQLYKEDGTVVIVTDTGDSGRGATVDAAFDDLEATTSGIIYLDTADFLLVSKEAAGEVQFLEQYLKPSIRVCFANKDIDPVLAAEYLAVHRPATKLKAYNAAENAEFLTQENGRLNLRQKAKK